jgi:hypothetical protein
MLLFIGRQQCRQPHFREEGFRFSSRDAARQQRRPVVVKGRKIRSIPCDTCVPSGRSFTRIATGHKFQRGEQTSPIERSVLRAALIKAAA